MKKQSPKKQAWLDDSLELTLLDPELDQLLGETWLDVDFPELELSAIDHLWLHQDLSAAELSGGMLEINLFDLDGEEQPARDDALPDLPTLDLELSAIELPGFDEDLAECGAGDWWEKQDNKRQRNSRRRIR